MTSCLRLPAFFLAATAVVLSWNLPFPARALDETREDRPKDSIHAGRDDACLGRRPLYRLSSGEFSPSGTPHSSLIAQLAEIPIAFAASGDPCLGPIPVYRLDLLVGGAPARSTQEMAKRLAPALADYSRRTGLEGCARMCETERGEVVARAVTIRSHVSCVAPEKTCPVGTIPTNETIHSHPPGPVFIANAVDLVGWGLEEGLGDVMWVGDPNQPSEEDRAAAPMWLVGADGGLRWLSSPEAQMIELP